MKIFCLIATGLFLYTPSFAQYWVAGDTTGFNRIVVEQTFQPEAKITIDIDCDGVGDLIIYSYLAVPANHHERLGLTMYADVQILNSGTSSIHPFRLGDTLFFADSIWWATSISHIYGNGGNGTYGHPSLNEKYIAFRKTINDTSYCFIKLSNAGLVLTIHQIISGCTVNPLEIVAPVDTMEEHVPELLFPNPFEEEINLDGLTAKEVYLYDYSGKQLLFATINDGKLSDLGILPAGVYFLQVNHPDGKRETFKVVKK